MRVEQPRSDELSSSAHHHRPARGIDVASGGGGLCLRPGSRAADERHPAAQQECHRPNQDRRLSRSGGLAPSPGPTSGLAGRRPEPGRDEGFGRHRRSMGSSSTVAKRCNRAQGEVACGVHSVSAMTAWASTASAWTASARTGWARTPRAIARIRQADVLAGGCGSPHDANSAGRGSDGRHVAVDPGEHLGLETEARAYGYAAGAWRNAEVKGASHRAAHRGWTGTTTSAMTPFLIGADSPGEPGSATPPRVRRAGRPGRGVALVSGAQESRSSWECRRVPSVTGLAAARGFKGGCSAAQRGARRCPSHPCWVWAEPGFAARSDLTWRRRAWSPALAAPGVAAGLARSGARGTWLESGSTGRPAGHDPTGSSPPRVPDAC